MLNCLVFSVGTPERNTVCKRCADGFFSNETSSKAPCRKHTNCSAFGLLLTQKGNATHDNVCSGNSESPQKCAIGNYISQCQPFCTTSELNTKPSGYLLSEIPVFPFLKVNQRKPFSVLYASLLTLRVKISPEVSLCHDCAPKLGFLPFTLESNLTHEERDGVKIMSKAKLVVQIVEVFW